MGQLPPALAPAPRCTAPWPCAPHAGGGTICAWSRPRRLPDRASHTKPFLVQTAHSVHTPRQDPLSNGGAFSGEVCSTLPAQRGPGRSPASGRADDFALPRQKAAAWRTRIFAASAVAGSFLVAFTVEQVYFPFSEIEQTADGSVCHPACAGPGTRAPGARTPRRAHAQGAGGRAGRTRSSAGCSARRGPSRWRSSATGSWRGPRRQARGASGSRPSAPPRSSSSRSSTASSSAWFFPSPRPASPARRRRRVRAPRRWSAAPPPVPPASTFRPDDPAIGTRE